MKQESTKTRIVEVALKLFSQSGYEAVSVEQIAQEVGIKAPSLYKHYKSKKEIFDAIFDEMQRRYDEETQKMNLHIQNGLVDITHFSTISTASLIETVQNLIRYSLHDEYVYRFRHLMTIEQFRSKDLSELYTKRYVDRIYNYHEQLFRVFMSKGILKKGDLPSVTKQYVYPILIELSICDREPEYEAQMMKNIAQHIQQFQDIYQERGIKNEK